MIVSAQDRDIFMLALVAYAEASDQGQDGIRGQIHSAINRHKTRAWYTGKNIAATLLHPYAYSCMNSNDPNRVRAVQVDTDDFIWLLCMEEAEAAFAGTSDDPTNGATHYFKNGSPEPNWVSGKKDGKQVAPPAIFTKQIGDHLFYKGVR